MQRRRMKQSNLVGPAGYVSMEDGCVGGFVQRGVAAAGDEVSVVEMGGEGAESQETRATEASVRGFWKAYRRYMGGLRMLRPTRVSAAQRGVRARHRRRPAGGLAGLLHRSLPLQDHHGRQLPARACPPGIVYADSRGMLKDRVTALREANIYERQGYRHLVGLPAIRPGAGDVVHAETPFLVVRVMRDGTMDLFATGRYVDTMADEDDTLRFRERLVVCDSSRVDTLLAIPL